MRTLQDAGNGRLGDWNRETELRFTKARRDIRVGLCVDVGVDAQTNRQRTAEHLCDALDDIELLSVLDVQYADASFGGRGDFLAPLADAAVHDALGREPRLEGALHFADRHDVCATSLRSEAREHR